MKSLALLLTALVLAACAAQEPDEAPSTQDVAQAIRDFIDVRELESVSRIRTSQADSWEALDPLFVLYKSRRETHLVEFGRACWELDDNTRIMADERRSGSYIYSRFDTIRGCRIHRIYALTEHDIAELENIGEAVGSRN